MPVSRLLTGFTQSQDSAISVACTIEPFEFSSYIKVRDVCNKLLQLRLYLQCRACLLKPPHQGLLGIFPTRRNSLPLRLGYIAISVVVPALHPSPSDAPVDILSGTMPATTSFQFRHVSISAQQRSLRCGQNLCGPFLRATLPDGALERWRTTGRQKGS